MTSTLFNIHRGKAKPVKMYDLMPYESEPPITEEQAMREWF